MTKPSFLRRIFVSDRGIRTGWRILIFLVLTVGVGALIGLAARYAFGIHPHNKGVLDPVPLMIGEALSCAVVIAACLVMARIEHRPFGEYGLGGPGKLPRFLTGLGTGIFTLSAVALTLAAAGALVFGGLHLHAPAPILGYGALWLLVFALVAAAEEMLFRGYIQATLTSSYGFWPATLATTAIFTLAHTPNKGESLAGLAGVIAAGIILCLLLRASGSLWLGIGFHAGWDWSQSYLYGTPDSGLMPMGYLLNTHPAGPALLSGGGAGPEGSILAAPILVIATGALLWAYRRPGRPALPRHPSGPATLPAAP